MINKPVITVTCDHCGAMVSYTLESHPLIHVPAAELRAVAQATGSGWLSIDGAHYCGFPCYRADTGKTFV